jgi:hypothetical protein
VSLPSTGTKTLLVPGQPHPRNAAVARRLLVPPLVNDECVPRPRIAVSATPAMVLTKLAAEGDRPQAKAEG